jgi:hypothetical protein
VCTHSAVAHEHARIALHCIHFHSRLRHAATLWSSDSQCMHLHTHGVSHARCVDHSTHPVCRVDMHAHGFAYFGQFRMLSLGIRPVYKRDLCVSQRPIRCVCMYAKIASCTHAHTRGGVRSLLRRRLLLSADFDTRETRALREAVDPLIMSSKSSSLRRPRSMPCAHNVKRGGRKCRRSWRTK